MIFCLRYIIIVVLLFSFSAGAVYSFTAVRPDYKPPTPLERRAAEREKRKNSPTPDVVEDPSTSSSESGSSGSYSGSSSSSSSSSSTDVTPAQPQPDTGTESSEVKPEKKDLSGLIVWTLFILIIVGIIVWYYVKWTQWKKIAGKYPERKPKSANPPKKTK